MKYAFVLLCAYLIIPKSFQENLEDKIAQIFGSDSVCDCTPSSLCKTIDRYAENKCSKPSYVCCTEKYKGCGYQNPVDAPWSSTEISTQQGEFPWMIGVLTVETKDKTNDTFKLYKCGGVLIHPQVVLTAAYCVSSPNKTYIIRAGEWDTQTTLELYSHEDRLVENVIIHKEFRGQSNNIALLFLKSPMVLNEFISSICLPHETFTISSGTRCFVSGWGKDVITFKYQTILKKVNVPIVDKNICLDKVKTIEATASLDDSLICAGGEKNVGVCKGDEGSPLVCSIPEQNDRYQLVGIVNNATACGQNQIPGVYTNIAKYRNWIAEQLEKHSMNMTLLNTEMNTN